MSNKNQKSQETSPSASKSPSPVECPFAKNGIVEALHQLTEEGGLLEQAVREQQKSNKITLESNLLAKKNSRLLRVVVLMFLGSVVVLLAVGALAWTIFNDVRVVEERMGQTVVKVDQMVEVQRLTDVKLDDAKKELDKQPKVELVAEQDPEKAKDAPIKVRITPPKNPGKAGSGKKPSHSPAPTQKAVEVPFPVKDARVFDAPEE
jgi:hypothetical protein